MTPAKPKRVRKGAQRSKPGADLRSGGSLKAPLTHSGLDSELALELAPRLRELSEEHAGMSPLEVMLKVMHELLAAAEQLGSTSAGQTGDLFGDGVMNESRIKLLNMAAAVGRNVAPYVHPRLSAIEHTGKNGAPLQSGVLLVPALMDIDEWEKAALAKPAA